MSFPKNENSGGAGGRRLTRREWLRRGAVAAVAVAAGTMPRAFFGVAGAMAGEKGGAEKDTGAQGASTPPVTESPPAPAGPAPRAPVTVAPPPARRVVSQTVFTDELLLEIGAPEQIASLSHLARDPQFAARPDAAARHPALPLNTDAEAILRHRPDLVLFTDFSRADLVSQVARAGIPTLTFSRYHGLEDALAALETLAARLGPASVARAKKTVTLTRERVAALATRLRGARPVRVISPSTFDILPGDGTNFQDYCEHACAENLAKTLGGLVGNVPVPGEKILRWPVEKVVLVGGAASGGDSPLPTPAQIEQALVPLRRKPPYRHLRAVREGRAALLPMWQSSCVSHHRVACYEYLARQLHPAQFAVGK